jgi:hypothetical protein
MSRKEDFKQIYERYGEIYDDLKRLEEKTVELSNLQRNVHQRLHDNREAERIVINKIEEELGRQLTQDDLLQMIRDHE